MFGVGCICYFTLLHLGRPGPDFPGNMLAGCLRCAREGKRFEDFFTMGVVLEFLDVFICCACLFCLLLPFPSQAPERIVLPHVDW